MQGRVFELSQPFIAEDSLEACVPVTVRARCCQVLYKVGIPTRMKPISICAASCRDRLLKRSTLCHHFSTGRLTTAPILTIHFPRSCLSCQRGKRSNPRSALFLCLQLSFLDRSNKLSQGLDIRGKFCR